jgi:hypothetical protein
MGVERALGWLNRFRRLLIRYERSGDIHLAFLGLGCALMCFRALPGLLTIYATAAWLAHRQKKGA